MYNASNMSLNVQININSNDRYRSGNPSLTLLHHVLLLKALQHYKLLDFVRIIDSNSSLTAPYQGCVYKDVN